MENRKVVYRAADSSGKYIYGEMDRWMSLEDARRAAAGGLEATGLGNLAKLTLQYDVVLEDYQKKGRGR